MQYGPFSPPGTDAQQTRAITNKLLISFREDSFHLQQGIDLNCDSITKRGIVRLEICTHLSLSLFPMHLQKITMTIKTPPYAVVYYWLIRFVSVGQSRVFLSHKSKITVNWKRILLMPWENLFISPCLCLLAALLADSVSMPPLRPWECVTLSPKIIETKPSISLVW